jgi:hypothetical protein
VREGDYAERLARVASLLEELEAAADPRVREITRELVRTLLELHERGLRRVLELAVSEPPLARAIGADAEIERLLFLHGLHPVPLAERLAAALREVAPALAREGSFAELTAVEDGAIRLRFSGGSAARQALLRAIDRLAPDAGEVLIEEQPPLVQLGLRRPGAVQDRGGTGA